MPGTAQEVSQVGTLPSINLGAVLPRIARALCGAVGRSRTRSIVAKLSEDQLRDIGVERSTVLGNKPAISVDIGVMTYLMSLR